MKDIDVKRHKPGNNKQVPSLKIYRQIFLYSVFVLCKENVNRIQVFDSDTVVNGGISPYISAVYVGIYYPIAVRSFNYLQQKRYAAAERNNMNRDARKSSALYAICVSGMLFVVSASNARLKTDSKYTTKTRVNVEIVIISYTLSRLL